MPKASLLFAAVILLAAGFSSPTFANRCYGLDPCEACRNCHACKHCHEQGGTCGICKRDKNAMTRGFRISRVPVFKRKGIRKAATVRTLGGNI